MTLKTTSAVDAQPRGDTLGGLMVGACRAYGDRVALVTKDGLLTYSQLLDRSLRLLSVFGERGLRPNDTVAAMLEDRLECIEVYLACAIGGYPIVHINDRLAAPEVAKILADAEVRAFIHTDGRSGVVEALELDDTLKLFGTIGATSARGAERLEDLIGNARPASLDQTWTPSPNDVAIVGYTSGTTGTAKGVVVTHGAVVEAIRTICAVYRIQLYGRCAFTGTLSFVSGIWGVILPHMVMGGSVHFLHPYTVHDWVDAILEDASTFTYAPTPLIPEFVEELTRRRGFTSLETVLHSGSSVPRQHVEALVEVVGDRYVEVWGMTEGVAPFTATVKDDWLGRSGARDRFGTCGRPFPGTEIWVGDKNGLRAPYGTVGELIVSRGLHFMGYLGDERTTREVLRPSGLWTGDVGWIDEAGYVYVTGRRKEMIISGGMNVFPAEVEAAVLQLDVVSECAVFGVPDDRWGERVAVAAVVMGPVSLSLLHEHLANRLASYKKPLELFIVDELPRNASLKVQREVLRSRLVNP